MIVKTVGFIICDDDGAVLPDVLVGGDRVDDTRGHSLRELAVGIARMIVVAGLRRLDRGELRWREAVLVGVVRVLDDGGFARIFEVIVAAANVENAARARQDVLPYVGEKISFAAQIGLLGGIVGDIAEILRAIVVAGNVLVG